MSEQFDNVPMDTLSVNLKAVVSTSGDLLVQVEDMRPMQLNEFARWLHGACRTDRNMEKIRHRWPDAREVRIAERENVKVVYDTRENPMPKAQKSWNDRITRQVAKLRRKHPNASSEDLRKLAENIEKSIDDALASLDFSDAFAAETKEIRPDEDDKVMPSYSALDFLNNLKI